METIDIFIKTYYNDFKMLNFSLLSITKHVEGYNKIIILVPRRFAPVFHAHLPERAEVVIVEDEGNGYLRQQAFKMNAHKYSDADYILFSDSDIIFDHKINLQDFIADDKPEILYTDYSQVGEAICWKRPTEQLLGEEVKWEFMRRNCLIYHRSTLENISKWEPNLEETIMKSDRFSEFNLIGAYAFKFEKDKYTFVNTDDWVFTPPKGIQLWSRASKVEGVSEVCLREYIRFLETILNLFEIEI